MTHFAHALPAVSPLTSFCPLYLLPWISFHFSDLYLHFPFTFHNLIFPKVQIPHSRKLQHLSFWVCPIVFNTMISCSIDFSCKYLTYASLSSSSFPAPFSLQFWSISLHLTQYRTAHAHSYVTKFSILNLNLKLNVFLLPAEAFRVLVSCSLNCISRNFSTLSRSSVFSSEGYSLSFQCLLDQQLSSPFLFFKVFSLVF